MIYEFVVVKLTDSRMFPPGLCHLPAPAKCLSSPALKTWKRLACYAHILQHDNASGGEVKEEEDTRLLHSTWVLSSSAPLDEADDQEDEDDDRHRTHDADEPALGGDVHLVPRVGWRHNTETVWRVYLRVTTCPRGGLSPFLSPILKYMNRF